MLNVAPVGMAAARYAVHHWHYSRAMPTGKIIRYGVWEGDRFIGVVLYSRGANRNIGAPYGVSQIECCELTRVALDVHDAAVTEIVAASLRLLRAANPGLRLVISYADPAWGHHGGIYQAGNWIYVGRSAAQASMIVAGEHLHKRTVGSKYGSVAPEEITAKTGLSASYTEKEWKHSYVMPFDRQVRRRVEKLAQTYPSREGSC